jgi:uncharacterized membrane protein YeaQ/YmgE (transglycosylase-associated protein family)
MLLGMVGALAGGMISWSAWSAEEDQLFAGNLMVAILGAVIMIVFGAVVSYARSVSGARKSS